MKSKRSISVRIQRTSSRLVAVIKTTGDSISYLGLPEDNKLFVELLKLSFDLVFGASANYSK